jgi:hypothetical protein
LRTAFNKDTNGASYGRLIVRDENAPRHWAFGG